MRDRNNVNQNPMGLDYDRIDEAYFLSFINDLEPIIASLRMEVINKYAKQGFFAGVIERLRYGDKKKKELEDLSSLQETVENYKSSLKNDSQKAKAEFEKAKKVVEAIEKEIQKLTDLNQELNQQKIKLEKLIESNQLEIKETKELRDKTKDKADHSRYSQALSRLQFPENQLNEIIQEIEINKDRIKNLTSSYEYKESLWRLKVSAQNLQQVYFENFGKIFVNLHAFQNYSQIKNFMMHELSIRDETALSQEVNNLKGLLTSSSLIHSGAWHIAASKEDFGVWFEFINFIRGSLEQSGWKGGPDNLGKFEFEFERRFTKVVPDPKALKGFRRVILPELKQFLTVDNVVSVLGSYLTEVRQTSNSTNDTTLFVYSEKIKKKIWPIIGLYSSIGYDLFNEKMLLEIKEINRYPDNRTPDYYGGMDYEDFINKPLKTPQKRRPYQLQLMQQAAQVAPTQAQAPASTHIPAPARIPAPAQIPAPTQTKPQTKPSTSQAIAIGIIVGISIAGLIAIAGVATALSGGFGAPLIVPAAAAAGTWIVTVGGLVASGASVSVALGVGAAAVSTAITAAATVIGAGIGAMAGWIVKKVRGETKEVTTSINSKPEDQEPRRLPSPPRDIPKSKKPTTSPRMSSSYNSSPTGDHPVTGSHASLHDHSAEEAAKKMAEEQKERKQNKEEAQDSVPRNSPRK